MARRGRRASALTTQGDLFVPFQGGSSAAAHASWSGARQAVKTYGQKTSAYLQLLNQAGALTDHEAAALMKCGLSSVNAIRNGLNKRARNRGDEDLIEPDGFDTQAWENGETRRTRWRIRRQ